ncbi:MAG TPA: serine/threonine-protein kinase [Polyangiaceae bacterium]|nr:serine/threonine-protein kinase [Polyangiaceae bacterium]
MSSADSKDEAESTPGEGARPPILPAEPLRSDEARDQYLNKVIADRYEIESYLGAGSMGTVYRCRHRVLGNYFAVKIIRHELLRASEAVDRFFTEARAASTIGSKHIVEVIDFGHLPNGAAYILMEYLQGVTLFKELERRSRLPAARAIDVAIQVADALGAAHTAGIVHRDLKPDNVFLLEVQGKDFVKVLDFGIAKVLSSTSKLTQVGTVVGTPAYMSPEQALGNDTDHRSDVYALGIMLYEMTCGDLPFTAENPMAVLSKQVSETARPLSERIPGVELPEGYEAVIAKCLAKHPNDRFQSMEEVKAALSALAAGVVPEVIPPRQSFRPSLTTPLAFVPTEEEEVPFIPKRKPAMLRIAGGLGLGTIAALGFFAFSGSEQPAPTPPAPVVAAATVAAPSPPARTDSVPPAAEFKEVHIVLYPIDAHAYDGTKDLGMMPITVKLAPGETKVLTISRRGYGTRKVTVDGSTSRVVAGLVVEGARDATQAERAADLAAAKQGVPTAKKTGGSDALRRSDPYGDNPYQRGNPAVDNPY